MLEDTATFQVLFIVSLFCAWNIITVINSGVHLLVNSANLSAFIYFPWFWSWSCKQRSWSCYFGLGLKNLVLFTSLAHTVAAAAVLK